MGDDAQTYDDANAVLQQIIEGTNYTPLFVAAREMKTLLDDELRSTMNFQARISLDEKEDPDAIKKRRTIVKRMANASFKAIKRATETDPKYKTPVFQCHGDYEKCTKSSSPKLCLALFVIC